VKESRRLPGWQKQQPNYDMNLLRYFATDRYAVYIWGSYGVTFVLLAGEVFMLWKRKRKIAGRDNPGLDSSESQFETSLQESQ